MLRYLAALLLFLLLGGCASTLPQVERTAEHALKADAGTPLGAAARDAALAAGMSGFRPLAQGAFALDARLALIDNAKVSIDLQTYLLGDDLTGRLVLRSLRDAAQRGVRVRLLLDDFYAAHMDPLLLGLAAYPNAQVRLFNPFLSGREGSIGRMLAFAGSFKRLNHRMHNKLLTVDGVMAVAGGRNTADEYFLRSPDANFVDFDLLITGDLLTHLGELFDLYWNSEQVLPVAMVASPRGTPADLRAVFDQLVAERRAPRPAPAPAQDLFGKPPVSTTLAQHSMPWIAARATAHADSPLKASLTEAGSEQAADTVRRRAFALLPKTQREVVMFSPYFIPGEAGIKEFQALRDRGVQIKVITNSLPTSDEPLVNVGYEQYRAPLLQMGAHLYELSSTRLGKVPTMHRALGQTKGRLHAKMGFIDREIVLIGSMNMDPRSANINTEIGISVHSPELAQMILEAFKVDHLEGVYEMKLKADGKTIAWASSGEDGDHLVEEEPDTSLWQRAQLFLQYLFISDDLL